MMAEAPDIRMTPHRPRARARDASTQPHSTLHHGDVSAVLVFANLELLSENSTLRFLERAVTNVKQLPWSHKPARKSVWYLCNHGGPTARAFLREPARWLVGPAAPARIEWIMRFNPFKNHFNGCEEDPEAMRRKVATARRHVPLRLRLLDNLAFLNSSGTYYDWSHPNMSTVLRRAAIDCLPGIPFQPLLERKVWERSHLKLPHECANSRSASCASPKALSTGAVAALRARQAYPNATVYAVGFTGHCSFLNNASGGLSDECGSIHDFAKERRMLRSAGVHLVARRNWLTQGSLIPFLTTNRRYRLEAEHQPSVAAASTEPPVEPRGYTCVHNLNFLGACIEGAPCPFHNLSTNACRAQCTRHAPACGVFLHNRYGQCFLKARPRHEELSRTTLARDRREHATVSCFEEEATDEYTVTATPSAAGRTPRLVRIT